MDKFHRHLASGEVLFRKGEPGTCVYILEEGALEVWTGPAHQPQVLARLGSGAFIGEMVLVARQPRLASVTALAPTVLGMITREHFSERLASSDPLKSCQDLVALQRQRPAEARPATLTMSVNLSTRQFFDPHLLAQLQAALQRQRVPPAQLRPEVTESLLLDNWEMALDLLHRAKALGVRLAMDDFGTGYRSLAYLHRLPVDTLKLD